MADHPTVRPRRAAAAGVQVVRATVRAALLLALLLTLAMVPAGTAAAVETTDPVPPAALAVTTTSPAGGATATGSGATGSSGPPSTGPTATGSSTGPPDTATATTGTTPPAGTTAPTTESSGTTGSTVSTGTTAPTGTTETPATASTTARPVPTAELPAVPPAAQRSGIGAVTIAIALAVLVLAVVVIAIVRRRFRTPAGPPAGPAPTSTRAGAAPEPESEPRAGPRTTPTPADGSTVTVARGGHELIDLLVELGDAMVRSGSPVTHVQADLMRIAAANGVPDAEIVVLPTALIITVPGEDRSRTEVATSGGAGLRLDQIDAVFRVAAEAEHAEIGVAEALRRLRAIKTLPPSAGPAVVVLGHAVIAVGLAIVLAGGWLAFPAAAVLGAGVGLVKWWAAGRSAALQVFVPIGCAFAVSAAVALLARTSLDPGFLPPVLGALVTFIPGGVLTTAVLELATGQMISGASRFISGGLQLVLLAIGIVGGVQLVGLPVITIAPAGDSAAGAVNPWLGVLVFGVGVLLTFSGRPRSLGWMLLVLYVAFAGQVLGGLLVGSYLSGFVGAALMTPVAVFAAGQRSGPPTMVTFLPAFWLLVPGAVALVGVTQVMGDTREAGVTSILTAGVTFVAIALGVVFGSALAPDWLRRRRR